MTSITYFEGILRQMDGQLSRCDDYGCGLPGHSFGSEDSFAKFFSGQSEPIHVGAQVYCRGPYRIFLKECGAGDHRVVYITLDETHWVREGTMQDFLAAGFKPSTPVMAS